MAIQKIPNGMSGSAASQIIFDNDKENEASVSTATSAASAANANAESRIAKSDIDSTFSSTPGKVASSSSLKRVVDGVNFGVKTVGIPSLPSFTSALTTYGIYYNAGTASKVKGIARRLNIRLTGNQAFNLIHLRLSGNFYTEVNRYAFSGGGNAQINTFDIPGSPSVEFGDLFGINTPNGNNNSRPYFSPVTGGAVDIKVRIAGDSGWVIPARDGFPEQTGSVSAFLFNVELDGYPGLGFSDIDLAGNGDVFKTASADLLKKTRDALGISVGNVGLASMPAGTSTVSSYGLTVNAGFVASGSGKARTMQVRIAGNVPSNLVHLRRSQSGYTEVNRYPFTGEAGNGTLTTIDLSTLDINLVKDDMFGILAISPNANGRVIRQTGGDALGYTQFSGSRAWAIPLSISQPLTGSRDYAIYNVVVDYLNLPSSQSSGGGITDVNFFENSSIGAVPAANLLDTDIILGVEYGQSLSLGFESYVTFINTPVAGNIMMGNSPFYDSVGDTFQPLRNSMVTTNRGETPITPALNALRQIYNRMIPGGRQREFLGVSCGREGYTIEQLSPGASENIYNGRFVAQLNRAKTMAQTANKTISCAFIEYEQGENNYVSNTTKASYKNSLVALKNAMQNSVVSILGQSEKPFFIIYQTSGTYINNNDVSISQAQLEFAMENPDVIMVGPVYPYPDYGNGHLTANGYINYGEQVAKGLFNIFVLGKRFTPIVPKKVSVSGTRINIDVIVPVGPLVIDNNYTDTKAQAGFRVLQNGTEIPVTLELNGSRISLVGQSNFSGTVEISYGAQARDGAGNVRDSDEWVSYYSYFDDSGVTQRQPRYQPVSPSGGSMFGLKYPVQNWMVHFYRSITV